MSKRVFIEQRPCCGVGHTDRKTKDDEQRHTVTAKTILDATVEIFEGTLEECETRLAEIDGSINEDSRMLRHHLCDGLGEGATISWRRR